MLSVIRSVASCLSASPTKEARTRNEILDLSNVADSLANHLIGKRGTTAAETPTAEAYSEGHGDSSTGGLDENRRHGEEGRRPPGDRRFSRRQTFYVEGVTEAPGRLLGGRSRVAIRKTWEESALRFDTKTGKRALRLADVHGKAVESVLAQRASLTGLGREIEILLWRSSSGRVRLDDAFRIFQEVTHNQGHCSGRATHNRGKVVAAAVHG